MRTLKASCTKRRASYCSSSSVAGTFFWEANYVSLTYAERATGERDTLTNLPLLINSILQEINDIFKLKLEDGFFVVLDQGYTEPEHSFDALQPHW